MNNTLKLMGHSSERPLNSENSSTHLERMSEESFGEMRDATKEELEGVDQYIKSISKSTGVDFFALC